MVLLARQYLHLLVGILIFFIGSNIVLAAKNIATNVPNMVTGTMGGDKMYGLDGKDNLYGLGGNDALQGDNGDDFVDGGPGKDSLEGNDGNDIVQGGAGADKIDGGKGNDTLIASFALGTVSFRDYSANSVV